MEEYEENNNFDLSLTAVVNRLQYYDAKLEHKTSKRIRQTSNFKSMEKKNEKSKQTSQFRLFDPQFWIKNEKKF